MSNTHVLPASVAAALVAVGAFAAPATASADFGPKVPGFDDPVVDVPTFPNACDDKKSPLYGWCLPDFDVDFDPINPTVGMDGSGFIAARIVNRNTSTKEPVWSTISVAGSELIDVTHVHPTADFEIERSWFDADTYFVLIPEGLDMGESAYIGLRFADAWNVDVEIEANFHADAEWNSFLGLDDYRIDERTYVNNTADYRYVVD